MAFMLFHKSLNYIASSSHSLTTPFYSLPQNTSHVVDFFCVAVHDDPRAEHSLPNVLNLFEKCPTVTHREWKSWL